MKKAISILLVIVMCLCMCACGEKSNEIELTLDNYDDYVEIHPGIYGRQAVKTDNDYWLGAYSQGYKFVENEFYTGYEGSLYTEVVAPNFNFHNVTVKIHFTGNVLAILEDSNPDSPTITNYSIDFDDTFELNVGGTLKEDEGKIIDLPQNLLILNSFWSANYDGKYEIKNVNWEIIEISGTVSPA